MRLRAEITLIAASLLLCGCAGLTGESYKSLGNAIVIARSDLRHSMSGSDFSGAAFLLGTTPTAKIGGAIGADVAVEILNAMSNTRPSVSFKVLDETTCEFRVMSQDLIDSPEAKKLYPGYIARRDSNASGKRTFQPLLDNRGQQIYLTKSHPCYQTWVAEWKKHYDLVQTTGKWTGRVMHIFDTPKFVPEPDFEWIK